LVCRLEVAAGAAKRLFSRVLPEVDNEGCLAPGLAVAVGALERFLPRVLAEVHFEGRFLCRPVVTVRARKGLLPRVLSEVHLEGGVVCRLEVAVWTRKGLLPCVRSNVHLEGGLLGCPVVTKPTDEWLLARVDPVVLEQSRVVLGSVVAKVAEQCRLVRHKGWSMTHRGTILQQD
jgi:hypothetical protein